MTALFILVLIAAITAGGAPMRADRTVGDLRFEMDVAKATYQPGEPIGVTMRVTNGSAGSATLTSSGQQYDVLVRQRGALVWQWSHDKGFTQAMRSVEIAAGETRKWQTTWDQRDLQGRPVDAGKYEISCLFLTVPRAGPPVEVGPVRITIAR
jgi:hypothetical protein